MTSLCKVLGGRFLLGVVLWACACQHDSVATFDATGLPGSPHGGALGAAGSRATAGDAASGGDDTSGAGASSEAGSTASAGKAAAPNGGGSGRGGSSAAGASGGGKPSTAGGGGSGGSAVAGGGGSGGTKDPEPQPVTITITDFADTHVMSCLNSNMGEAQTLTVDSASICVYQALMNPSLADVPDGALVSAATLALHCIDGGDVLTVSYVSEPWDEDTVRWNTRPEPGSEFAELSCDDTLHANLDLTAAVKAWVSGERAANGLYFSTDGSDGTDFASSEYGEVAERPSLSVTYTLAPK
jgi:hypothetical protein